MISKDEVRKAANMSWQEMQENYPKVTMVMEWVSKHYPDDVEKVMSHKMLPPMLFGNYSNPEIESMIDKLAIFNGWKKYEPTS